MGETYVSLETLNETEDLHAKAMEGLCNLRLKDMTVEEQQQFIHNTYTNPELNKELIEKYHK